MARVLTVGGIFFRSPDPKALGAWYAKWLGVPVENWNGAAFKPADVPSGGYAVWCPFPKDTTYFDPPAREFMVNLMVDDLDGALAQVREGGAEIVGEPEVSEFGRFGWFIDPDGNKIELWQPPA